jgi:magnesium transporter
MQMLTTYPQDSTGRAAPWLDLLDPTEGERAKVSAEYEIEVPSRQQLEEIESSSRLRVHGEVLIMSLPLASRSGTGEPMPTPLGFVLTPKALVTIRFAELHAIAPALESMKSAEALGSADIFATVLEAMVDYSADLLEQIAGELNTVSRGVFKRSGRVGRRDVARSNRALKQTLALVGEAGDHLSHIRESILGLQRMTPFALEKGQKWIGDAVQARLRTVGQDLLSLADFEVHLTDKVQFLLDAILGFINTEQNDIFKVLTIVSVVGIPPTLIAGMYGMNFDTIHEYHWHYGYLWGLSLIALSAILPTAWFKWRGWL